MDKQDIPFIVRLGIISSVYATTDILIPYIKHKYFSQQKRVR